MSSPSSPKDQSTGLSESMVGQNIRYTLTVDTTELVRALLGGLARRSGPVEALEAQVAYLNMDLVDKGNRLRSQALVISDLERRVANQAQTIAEQFGTIQDLSAGRSPLTPWTRHWDTCEQLLGGKCDCGLTAARQAVGGSHSLTSAAQDVLAERLRQVKVEGWTPEHDDAHRLGQMACAAACYAIGSARPGTFPADNPPGAWPWSREWWKPKTVRRDLVKAGALILAEIERLDRLVAREVPRV